jgi:hypothetical protein
MSNWLITCYHLLVVLGEIEGIFEWNPLKTIGDFPEALNFNCFIYLLISFFLKLHRFLRNYRTLISHSLRPHHVVGTLSRYEKRDEDLASATANYGAGAYPCHI